MTATAFVIATFASAGLAVGVWLVMTGAVIATTAGEVETDADRRYYHCTGIVMAVIGLALFITGTIVGVEWLA